MLCSARKLLAVAVVGLVFASANATGDLKKDDWKKDEWKKDYEHKDDKRVRKVEDRKREEEPRVRVEKERVRDDKVRERKDRKVKYEKKDYEIKKEEKKVYVPEEPVPCSAALGEHVPEIPMCEAEYCAAGTFMDYYLGWYGEAAKVAVDDRHCLVLEYGCTQPCTHQVCEPVCHTEVEQRCLPVKKCETRHKEECADKCTVEHKEKCDTRCREGKEVCRKHCKKVPYTKVVPTYDRVAKEVPHRVCEKVPVKRCHDVCSTAHCKKEEKKDKKVYEKKDEKKIYEKKDDKKVYEKERERDDKDRKRDEREDRRHLLWGKRECEPICEPVCEVDYVEKCREETKTVYKKVEKKERVTKYKEECERVCEPGEPICKRECESVPYKKCERRCEQIPYEKCWTEEVCKPEEHQVCKEECSGCEAQCEPVGHPQYCYCEKEAPMEKKEHKKEYKKKEYKKH